jgi:hypothetical protein
MRRRLLLVAVIFASAVPPAASAPPTISIQSHTTVSEGWKAFQVYGAAAGARVGELVDVEAYLCDGYGIWQSEGKTDVGSAGTWATDVAVLSNAKLRARWRSGVSNTISVQIHPHVLLQPQGPGRWAVSVNANSFFDGRRGVFERLRGTKWVRVRSFKLSGGHSVGVVWSTARFRAHVKAGTYVRAVLPKSQVGRCYLAGFSNTFKA